MHAVVIHETGGTDVLHEEDLDRPEPGEREVLIRVHAASVNPVDWKQRQNLDAGDLPAVLGKDVSGVVEVSNADGFSEGDEVFGNVDSGGYAEYATASAGTIARKPASISHEQAAAIPVSGITAWQSLFDKGGLQSGQTALVAGAAGGVGHFAVQFAKHAGATVIGTASGRNRDFVLGLGADEFVDYTAEEPPEGAADLVFDTVGVAESLVPAVREGGAIIVIATAPPEEAAKARHARAELLVADVNTRQLEQIAELVDSGEVRVEVAETFSLSDTPRAHELSEDGHVRGKLVLTLDA
jgi:NADPH:quinone reductase-like Zn-dependent oxidoreductase